MVDGIVLFFGGDPDNFTLNADQVNQGITNRIIELADQAIARNDDGTVSSITYTDINTGSVLLTEVINYNAQGQPAEIVGTDAAGAVTAETLQYIDDALNRVEVSVSGF